MEQWFPIRLLSEELPTPASHSGSAMRFQLLNDKIQLAMGEFVLWVGRVVMQFAQNLECLGITYIYFAVISASQCVSALSV